MTLITYTINDESSQQNQEQSGWLDKQNNNLSANGFSKPKCVFQHTPSFWFVFFERNEFTSI